MSYHIAIRFSFSDTINFVSLNEGRVVGARRGEDSLPRGVYVQSAGG